MKRGLSTDWRPHDCGLWTVDSVETLDVFKILIYFKLIGGNTVSYLNMAYIQSVTLIWFL